MILGKPSHTLIRYEKACQWFPRIVILHTILGKHSHTLTETSRTVILHTILRKTSHTHLPKL